MGSIPILLDSRFHSAPAATPLGSTIVVLVVAVDGVVGLLLLLHAAKV